MKHHKIILTLLFCILLFQSCQISHSIPFDFPEYKPELIIHAVVSPQSGATVLIKYNQPVNTFPGEVPDLSPLEVYLVEEGNQRKQIHLDSLSIQMDNQYEVETAHFSLEKDSLNLKPEMGYSLLIIDQSSFKRYESSTVYLPPKPEITELDVDCSNSGQQRCFVAAHLGSVQEPVSAISITGRYLDTTLIDNYFRPWNSRFFNPDLIYPEVDSWENYLAISSFFQSIRPPHDAPDVRYKVQVSIAYLSYDIAQLIREVNGSYAIGEDIFANLQPFHSNFDNAFGVFGLYNEDVREMEL